MTMFIVVVPNFTLLVIITLFMGLADGCFVSVMGPIAFDLVGQKGAAQAIGCILGLCSIPLTVGPPIAGKLMNSLQIKTSIILLNLKLWLYLYDTILLIISNVLHLFLGLIYDEYKTYTGAFLIAGLPPLIFGSFLSITRCVRSKTTELEEKDPNEPKLLGPVSELHGKEGKQSAIVLTDEHPLLQSKNINPNYMK